MSSVSDFQNARMGEFLSRCDVGKCSSHCDKEFLGLEIS
jgi:hypothetical protein